MAFWLLITVSDGRLLSGWPTRPQNRCWGLVSRHPVRADAPELYFYEKDGTIT